jgi:hypothetical protein
LPILGITKFDAYKRLSKAYGDFKMDSSTNYFEMEITPELKEKWDTWLFVSKKHKEINDKWKEFLKTIEEDT